MSVISDVYTLQTYADEVLAAAATALEITDEGTPAEVYMTATRPAFDCCPALILYVPLISEGTTSPVSPAEVTGQRVTFGAITQATYVLTIIRCAANFSANGNPPSLDSQIAVAHQTQQDIWALWNGLRNAVRAGELFETCTGVHFDNTRPIQEEGGCVGWTLTIRAMIPGIPL